MNDQVAEDSLGMRNEVMDSLAQHQSLPRDSIKQVHNQVDQRTSEDEDPLKK